MLIKNENFNFTCTIFVFKNSASRIKNKWCFSTVLYLKDTSDCDTNLLLSAFRILYGNNCAVTFLFGSLDE